VWKNSLPKEEDEDENYEKDVRLEDELEDGFIIYDEDNYPEDED